MALAALKFAGNYQEQKINHLFPETKLEKIYAQLDSDPEFRGVGVTFIGYNSELPNYLITGIERESLFFVRVLRNSCRADGKTIYIREIKLPKY